MSVRGVQRPPHSNPNGDSASADVTLQHLGCAQRAGNPAPNVDADVDTITLPDSNAFANANAHRHAIAKRSVRLAGRGFPLRRWSRV